MRECRGENQAVCIIVTDFIKCFNESAFGQSDAVDDGGCFGTRDVVFREKVAVGVAAHDHACFVQREKVGGIRALFRYVRNRLYIVFGGEPFSRKGVFEDDGHFAARGGTVVVVKCIGFDNAFGCRIVHIRGVPFAGRRRVDGFSGINCRRTACHGDGFGNRYIAVRRKQAAADAVHKAEFIGTGNFAGIPLGSRNIGELPWRIRSGFVKTGRTRTDTECCRKQCGKENLFVHVCTPFALILDGSVGFLIVYRTFLPVNNTSYGAAKATPYEKRRDGRGSFHAPL